MNNEKKSLLRIKPRTQYNIFIIAFVVFNLLNTYLLTAQTLNRYIVSFDRTFFGEMTSLIGNVCILILIVAINSVVFKKGKGRMVSLLVITFALNTLLFSLCIFNKYYNTSFSLHYSYTLFKNPATGLGGSILIESLKELFSYVRILYFLPFVLLLIYYFLVDKEQVKKMKFFPKKVKEHMIAILYSFIGFFICIGMFSTQLKKWPLNAASNTYGVQNMGVYSYYLFELLGENFIQNADQMFSEKDEDKLVESLYKELDDNYNKNKFEYNSIFDEKNSNRLSVSETNAQLSGDLAGKTEINGLLKDKNIVLIHMETFNYFLRESPEITKNMPFLNFLLDESYVFENFYTNVGVGNSSDAEFSIATGLYANGYSTIYWDYNEKNEKTNYNFPTLAKYFKEYYGTNSIAQSLHSDIGEFYNRKVVHPNMLGFSEGFVDSKAITEQLGFSSQKELNEFYKHENPWITDKALIDVLNKKTTESSISNTPFFYYPITMMPHVPFLYDPYGDYNERVVSMGYPEKWTDDLSKTALRYLNYMHYYDKILKQIFQTETNSDGTFKLKPLKDTAYVFYADHGSSLNKKDLGIICDSEFSDLELRQKMAQTLSFIYVPDENGNGMLKGKQNLVRSQIDLHRTLIELFDFNSQKNMYFGVNGFSNEKTFAIENKALDVFMDDYMFSLRKKSNQVEIPQYILDRVYRFKQINDAIVTENLFHKINKKSNER